LVYRVPDAICFARSPTTLATSYFDRYRLVRRSFGGVMRTAVEVLLASATMEVFMCTWACKGATKRHVFLGNRDSSQLRPPQERYMDGSCHRIEFSWLR
jgi:hypothetical protein